MSEGTALAARLNGDSHSAVIDRAALDAALRAQGEDFSRRVNEHCPHLYADVPLFVSVAQVEQMRAVIAAVQRVVMLPAWSGEVLPEARRQSPQAKGVFFGYDFHLNADGAHLIEINTNAGGGLLNALLLQSQCNAAMPGTTAASGDLERAFLDMFRSEWRLQRGDAPLRSVAIVDEAPEAQFLYPEFVLAQRMFERAGLQAKILDPAELEAGADGLYHGGQKIDLIYNRLTDFFLERHVVLREAYEAATVVLTPHPHAYAMYADKRNLVRFSDPVLLRSLGADGQAVETLAQCIPQTRLVHAEDAGLWWNERRQWFFKPATGYGSRGSYRGDKVTRRVFDEILHGNYVAQRLALPGERTAEVGGLPSVFKYDVRCYVYDGEVQLVSAALYQGQTHNARTPGGGFSLVRIVG